MEIVLKTLLYSYPSLDIVVDGLEKLAEYKAITSFSNCHKTFEQMENIIKINDQMARVKELHSLTDDILKKLSVSSLLMRIAVL